jgi:hypothetical protein
MSELCPSLAKDDPTVRGLMALGDSVGTGLRIDHDVEYLVPSTPDTTTPKS